MPTDFQTTAPIFILIVIGYIALCFVLGAKKIFFDSGHTIPEDPEHKSSAGKEAPSEKPHENKS